MSKICVNKSHDWPDNLCMQAAGLNEVPLGGLSSYSLLLMLLAHLQIEGWQPISSAAFSIEQAKAATCAAPTGAAVPAEVTAGPAGPQQQPAVAPAAQPAAHAASKAAAQPAKPTSAKTASSPAAQPAAKSASQPRPDAAQAGEASPAKAEHDAFGPGELSPEPEMGGLADFVPLASVSPSAAGAAGKQAANTAAAQAPKGSTAAAQTAAKTVGKTVGTDAVEAEVPVSKAGAVIKPGFAQGLASIGAALQAQAAARKQPAGQPGTKSALSQPDSKDAAGLGPGTPAVAKADLAAAAPASDEKPVALHAAMAADEDAQVSHTMRSGCHDHVRGASPLISTWMAMKDLQTSEGHSNPPLHVSVLAAHVHVLPWHGQPLPQIGRVCHAAGTPDLAVRYD